MGCAARLKPADPSPAIVADERCVAPDAMRWRRDHDARGAVLLPLGAGV
jgi:hypothetical protein